MADPALVLLPTGEQGQMAYLQYPQIDTLQWKGTVTVGTAGSLKRVMALTGSDANAEEWLCKADYCAELSAYYELTDGREVWFTPSVNSKYRIARQLQPAADGKPVSVFTGRGVVIIYPRGEAYGWIGSTFMTPAYSQLTGKPMPKGNVSFLARQLDEALQMDTFYIVEYTCKEDPRKVKQYATSVRVIDTLPKEECCCLTVAEDGSYKLQRGDDPYDPSPEDPIQTIRDLSGSRRIGLLSLLDGTSMPVRLLGSSITHVTVKPLDGTDPTPRSIDLLTVRDFRPQSIHQASSPVGELAFCLRSLASSRPMGVLSLNNGTTAPAQLLACTETHATLRPLGCTDQTVQMVPLNTIAGFRARGQITNYRPAQGYGYISGSVWFHANDMTPGYGAPQEGMFVTYCLKRELKNGQFKVNAVEIQPEATEERQGWLIGSDLDAGTCRLRELGQEADGAPGPETWLLPPDPKLEQQLKRCQFDAQDYRACWRLVQLADCTFAELVLINTEETLPKKQFGYLSAWWPTKHEGFIFRPDQVDESFRGLRTERGIYLHENEIRKNLTDKPLPNPWNYSSFAVSYEIADASTKRPYAINVTVLYDAQARARAAKFFPEPPPSPLLMAEENRLDLTPFAAEGEEIGILGLCSNHSGKIFRIFESGYTPQSPDDVILFNPQAVEFSCEERPNTAKTLYLVRYKKQGTTENTFTGQLHPTLAEGSTVTILKEYNRPLVQRLEVIDNDTALMERYTVGTTQDAPEPEPEPSRPLDQQLSTVPGPLAGENLLLTDEAGVPQQFCTAQMQDDALHLCTAAGEDLGTADELSGRILRFGCITAFDPELGVGLMNDAWTFPLDSAAALLPMLKSQKSAADGSVGLYCVFRCENGSIAEVQRLRKYWSLLSWSPGTLRSVTKAPAQILIEADGKTLSHRTTTETYPAVKRRIKNNTHAGLPLWLRRVTMAWAGEEAPTLHPEAVDLHSTEQTPTIRYVESTDSYEGYENQTEHFAVQGSRIALQALENQTAAVVFAPAPDGTTLECRLKSDAVAEPAQPEEPDDLVENAKELPSAPLMQLYLRSADLSQTALRGLDLDEAGLPRTANDAIKAFKQLFNPRRTYYPDNWQNHLVAARIALAYPEDIHQAPRVHAILLGVLRMRLRALARSADAVYGELAYALALLMQLDCNRNDATDYRTWLLLQDLGTPEEIVNYETGVTAGRAVTAEELCARPLPEGKAESLLAHLLMLDPVSAEQLCPLLERNEPLFRAVKERAIAVSEEARRCTTLSDLVRQLRSAAAHDRQNFAVALGELCARQSDICDDVARLTGIMERRWLKLVCPDDRDRLMRLHAACESATNYMKLGGFARQEQELVNAWRTLDALAKECRAHPCRETTELLLVNSHLDENQSVLRRLKNEVTERLTRLYSRDSVPAPVCELNEESLPLARFRHNEAELQLIVRNGDNREMLQNAENPVLRLESLTPGIQVTPEIRLDRKLAAGEEVAVLLSLPADDEETLASPATVLIEWQTEFQYSAAFRDGRALQHTGNTGSSSEPLVLQLVSTQHEIKNPNAQNPYAQAAQGLPLQENSRIYRHRSEEDTILRSIIAADEAGAETFRHGATVILHGQKKSGKTSLINQVKAYVERSEALSSRALIIDFDSTLSNVGGVSQLHNFLAMFCDAILQRFDQQVRQHRDLRRKMRENGLRIPDLLDDMPTAYARFSRFFTQFNDLDNGEHTVLLFMDEFTTLCTSLLTEIESARAAGDTARVNYLQHIPDFIKDFSGKGFIQVIIGHEAMMRSLNTLGMMNQTAEFATTVELTALRPSEAEELIRIPMIEAFGYDPYRTPLGASAVEYLKDITGCHPTFLVRACREVFDYYTDETRFPAARTQLTHRDTVAAMNRYITALTLKDFDILTVEDGDGVESPEERKTYRYLKCAAQLALASYDRRTADSREVADQMAALMGNGEAERIRNILEARHVIRFTEGGRLHIVTGLFLEYIRQRNGGKQ